VSGGRPTARRSAAAEAAVIEALRHGDEEAFARLVDQHQAALRRMARIYVSSAAVADEVVQDTWLAVIQGVWAFEGRSSLKTWIFRILINRAKTRALREARSVPLPDAGTGELSRLEDSFDPAQSDADLSSPESRALTGEARALVRAAIDALPRRQRVVITMRDLEGCSSEEVCNVLGLTETNQRVLLHRARSKVRSMLARYFREG
jgi:RNA polymerase sigma-70 factor (ECF subfamily)